MISFNIFKYFLCNFLLAKNLCVAFRNMNPHQSINIFDYIEQTQLLCLFNSDIMYKRGLREYYSRSPRYKLQIISAQITIVNISVLKLGYFKL